MVKVKKGDTKMSVDEVLQRQTKDYCQGVKDGFKDGFKEGVKHGVRYALTNLSERDRDVLRRELKGDD